MPEKKVIPTCHNCGSSDLDIDRRDEVQSYKILSAVCNGCGWWMWVEVETGLTWIPGRSDEIIAEIEVDMDDDYQIAI